MKKEIKERDAHLEMATEDILPPLSLCFIDRFRGTYPLGESFSTPLINYKGSFQKQLLSIDYASFIIFNSIRECLNIQGENIDKHYFCSFIGTSFSPSIITFNVGYHKYSLATLQIPIDSFLAPKDLYYLFHEIGHMILYALDLDIYVIEELSGLKILHTAFEEIESLLQEILADYILFVFGFESNFVEFENFFYDYTNKIYHHETPHEAKFRVSIIKAFSGNLQDPDNLTKQLEVIKRELKKSDWPNRAEAVIAVDFLLTEIKENCDYFIFFEKTSNFMKIKNKISSSVTLDNIKQFFNSNSFGTWLEIYKDYYCDRNF